MKRLSIFFHYNEVDAVGDFVYDYLTCLRSSSDFVIFVNNGALDDATMQRMGGYVDHILVRENTGFDSWAYKAAIDYMGWERIRQYDELILCNFTSYASKNAIQSMLDVMASNKCDFWGVAKHPQYDHYFLPEKKTGYVHEHIMSYFMVFRKSVLQSDVFSRYWERLPKITNYAEAVGLHETVLTKHLEDLGFESGSYIDLKKTERVSSNASVFQADDFLERFDCQLLKRKAFFHSYRDMVAHSNTRQGANLLRRIEGNDDFNLNSIWDDLLRTQSVYSLIESLHLTFIHDTQAGKGRLEAPDAVGELRYWLYVESREIALFLLEFLRPIRSALTIYIDFASAALQAQFFDAINAKLGGNACVIDGGECSEKWFNSLEKALHKSSSHELLCFIALESPPSVVKWLLPYYHSYRDVLENLVDFDGCGAEITSFFSSNPKLGLLLSPAPTYAAFNPFGLSTNGDTQAAIQELCADVGVPNPLAGEANTARFVLPARHFWIRGGVLTPDKITTALNNKPKADESTFVQALLPIFAQSNGYFSGNIACEQVYISSHDNLKWKLRNHLHTEKGSGQAGKGDKIAAPANLGQEKVSAKAPKKQAALVGSTSVNAIKNPPSKPTLISRYSKAFRGRAKRVLKKYL